MNIGTAFGWNSSTDMNHFLLGDKRYSPISIHNAKCNIYGSAMIMHGLAQQHSMLQFLVTFAHFLHCWSCALPICSDPKLPEIKQLSSTKKERKTFTLNTTHKLQHLN